MSEFDNNQNDNSQDNHNGSENNQNNSYQPNQQDYNKQPYRPNNNFQNNGYYGSGYNTTPNYVYNPTQSSNSTDNQQFNVNGQNNYQPYMVPEKKPSRNKKKGVAIFASILAVIALFSIVLIVLSVNGKIFNSTTNEKIDGPQISVNNSPNASNTNAEGELTAAGVYDKVKDSSVGVLVYSANTSVKASEGSGVIVGEDDGGKYTYIITCAHVVSGGGTIKIQLHDETQYDATLIGYDSKTDIAVLRIAVTGLSAVEIGDSASLSVGQTVYAIGNPGGVNFAGSFTNGIVSAIARPIDSKIGYEMVCIQHTAAINPGNSGGALVNSYGQLVGINSSKIANTDYEGMGFSVPSTTFVEVYNEIISNGYVTNRPKLGILYTPASANQTYSMIVGVKGLPAGSLIIKSIASDSKLVGTDVAVGDLITKVNGKELESANTLPDLIEKSKVGDKLTLTICRFDNNYQMTEFEVEVELVEDKGDTTPAQETTTQSYNYYNPFGSYGYGN